MQPNGPLPPEVYWRRRAVALAAAVVALLMLIWLVVALTGSSDEPAESAGSGGPAGASAQRGVGAPLSGTGPAADPVTTGHQAPLSPPPPETADRALVTPVVAATTSAVPTPPAATPVPVPPPGPPQPCADAVVAVAAIPERPEYRVGGRPVLQLAVGNAGAVACTRDLDASLQELLLYATDGVTRLWSSNDCYPGDSQDVRTLRAGETVVYRVAWAGRSSQPGCPAPRVPVAPGDYLLVARLGPLTSTPAALRLLP